MKKQSLPIFFSFLLVACSPAESPAEAPAEKATTGDITPVSVAQVTAYTEVGSSYTATLVPRFQTPVAFRLDGQIVARYVEPGDRVSAGQRLARLDAADIKQRLKAAETTLSAAEKSLIKAENDWQRGQQLFDRGAIGDEQLEQYRVMLESARDQRQQAQSQRVQAENALGYSELKAPLDGVVVKVMAQPGLVVSAGQPVVELAQGGPLQAVVDLPEQVTAAPTAQLQLADKNYSLQRFSVSGALDPQTFTRRVRYNFTQTPTEFSYGQLAQLQLPANSVAGNSGALAVPVSAIDERGDKARVWVVRDQHTKVVEVSVLAIDHDSAMLQSDSLNVGDFIIAHGINRLTDGQQVRVVE